MVVDADLALIHQDFRRPGRHFPSIERTGCPAERKQPPDDAQLSTAEHKSALSGADHLPN
jgi:hypothetical protein